MEKGVKRMYKEGLANQEFNKEAKETDPEGYFKPGCFATNVEEHVYIAVYYGWLLGKGRFKRSNYYY